MKQDKVFEATKQAIEGPLRYTHSVIKKSEGLRKASPKVAKIGMAVGRSIGTVLLLVGVVQLLIGKPVWAIGSLSAGALTAMSHFFKKRKE